MLSRKQFLFITSVITTITFLWSQLLWAAGLELFANSKSVEIQKIFALDAQKISAENSCANSIKSSEKPLILALNTLKMPPKINTGLGHNDDLGRMTGYTEILNQFGFTDATQANILFGSAKLWENVANVNADLLKTTTTTKRSEITYNVLNQITGYTDVIASADGTKQSTSTMSNMTYLPTGELNGYTQTTTEYENQYDETGAVIASRAKQSQTAKIYQTTYDSLGRVASKTGTIDGEDYSYEVRAFDAVGRPVQYIETQGDAEIVHFGILFDSLGRVSEEYIKTSAESGSGIFETEEKSLTQYRYTYDQYGIRDTSYENEIYHEVSSNPLGTIIKAVIGIAATIIAGPLGAAAASFVTGILSGADPLQAFLSAAISFAVAYIGAEFAQNLGFGAGFSFSPIRFSDFISNPINVITEVLGVVDQLMVDDQGRGLFEQTFGKWGAVVFEGIQILGGMMGGVIANKSPPTGYQIFGALGRMLTLTAITALGDNLSPYLKQALSGFFSSFFGGISQGLNPKALGYTEISDNKWVKWDETGTKLFIIDTKTGKTITDIYDEQGNYIHSETVIARNEVTKQSLTAVTDEFGNIQYYKQQTKDGLTYLDSSYTSIFTTLKDGRIISYDIHGNIEGILAKGALPSWDNYGKFNSSYIEGNKGTTYYDNGGNYTGFTPNGFTVVKAGDKVAYSYVEVSPNSFYMVDSDGNNQKLVTQQLDSNKIPVGEYISDDKTIEYYDSRGIKVWDRANKTNSNINLYLEDGSKWAEITTNVNKNNLVSSYIFENKLTNETSLYDWTGALDSTIDTKSDYYQYNEKGEIVLYVPIGFDIRRNSETQQVIDVIRYDDQGNFISYDPKGRINYKVTTEGDTYFFRTDGRLDAIMYGWDTDANNLKTFTHQDDFNDQGNLYGTFRLSSDGLLTRIDKDGNELYIFNLAEIQRDVVNKGNKKLADTAQNLTEKAIGIIDKIQIIPEIYPLGRIPISPILIQRLTPFIENLPLKLNSIFENALDLISTPAFAKNGEAEAQILVPEPIQSIEGISEKTSIEVGYREEEKPGFWKGIWSKTKDIANITKDFGIYLKDGFKEGMGELFAAGKNILTKTKDFYLDQAYLIGDYWSEKAVQAKDFYLDQAYLIGDYWTEKAIQAKDFYLDQAYLIGDFWTDVAIKAKDFYLEQAYLIGDFWIPGHVPEGMDKNAWGMWEDLVTPSDPNSFAYHFVDQLVNGNPLKTAGHYYWDPLVEAKNELMSGANKIMNTTKDAANTIKDFGIYLKDELKTGMAEVAKIWGNTKEQYEKASNFYHGFGFRTDEQIAQEKALEVIAAKAVGRSGDIVSASGDAWWAFYIKAGEMTGVGDKNLDIATAGAKYFIAMAKRFFSDDVNKPIPNHTGMLIRRGDEVYVMEINPGYFRVIPIEEFAKNYKDITIMRPSNEKTEKIANTMFKKQFDQITLQPIGEVPTYNTLGLFGIGNIDSLANKNGAICSEWVYQGFNEYSKIVEGATNPLGVIGRDNRISPYDIDYTSPLWDENILDIYYSEYPDQSRRN